jgi:hypothetical protein
LIFVPNQVLASQLMASLRYHDLSTLADVSSTLSVVSSNQYDFIMIDEADAIVKTVKLFEFLFESLRTL